MRDIAIYGAGGFFDDVLPVGCQNEYGKVLGGIDALNTYKKELTRYSYRQSQCCEKRRNHPISFPNIIALKVLFFR
ncbi:MAG: hypothetical protein K2O17_08995 [Bacteroidaceae bacterium]|nr:hypothetical protein [Bacteroidaceae bacterium]